MSSLACVFRPRAVRRPVVETLIVLRDLGCSRAEAAAQVAALFGVQVSDGEWVQTAYPTGGGA